MFELAAPNTSKNLYATKTNIDVEESVICGSFKKYFLYTPVAATPAEKTTIC